MTRLTAEQRREIVRQVRAEEHIRSASDIRVRRAPVTLEDGKVVVAQWELVQRKAAELLELHHVPGRLKPLHQ